MVSQTGPVSVALRRGGPPDRAFILGLARESFVEFGEYGEIIARWLDASGVVSVIARQGATPVGFAVVAPHRRFGVLRPRVAELVAIAVAPGLRSRGVGRVLLERGELVSRGWGAPELRLHTAVTNAVARRFFAGAGYRERDSDPSYYPNGQEALELIRRLP